MSWHVDQGMIDRYVGGRMGEVDSDSVEAHLVGCDECRGTIGGFVGTERRERIWIQLRDLVEQPAPRAGERILRQLGVAPHTARLLALTPSVRPSWLLAVSMILFLAMMASSTLDGGPIVFLVIAPLVPVIGVAVAFGHPVDPVYEIGLVSPTGGFRLMLVRATAVLTASVAVTAVPSLFLTELRWMVVWMLPALAVTVLTLIVSTVTTVPLAAAVVSTLWVAGVIATELATSTPLAVFGAPAQLVFGVVAAGLMAVLLVRRPAFERL